MDASSEVQDRIRRHVRMDLEPPFWLVYLKVTSAILVGGMVSLFLCGQFGLALSPTAMEAHVKLHHVIGVLPCLAVCGFIFAVIPTISLRLICRPLQFRRIIRHDKGAIALCVVAFGAAVQSKGELWQSWGELALWSVAALVSTWLVAQALDILANGAKGIGFFVQEESR